MIDLKKQMLKKIMYTIKALNRFFGSIIPGEEWDALFDYIKNQRKDLVVVQSLIYAGVIIIIGSFLGGSINEFSVGLLKCVLYMILVIVALCIILPDPVEDDQDNQNQY